MKTLPTLLTLALAAALIAVITLSRPVRAARPEYHGPAEAALLTTGDPDSLRASLLALASELSDPTDAALALYYRGVSFERAAMPDSAIASYRRSLALDPETPAQEAFVDALLRRRAPGDVDEVIKLLQPSLSAQPHPELALHPDPARLGWAYVLAGDATRGGALLRPLEPRLSSDFAWRYRLARAYQASDQEPRALSYILSLAVAARGQDSEIQAMLRKQEADAGPNSHFLAQAKSNLARKDAAEAAALQRMGGRRVRIPASDETLLGAALFADSTTQRPARPAIVLGDLGGAIADCDSLVAGLRGAGLAVLLLDPRGWGWSVSPGCALPDTWEGRQDALEARVARDVREAIEALAQAAHVDTTRCLLIGVGTMGPTAVAAARADARIAALALLDPWTSPVERGATIARARAFGRPSYIQLGLLNRPELTFLDALYRVCPLPGSRFLPVPIRDGGPTAFRQRAAALTPFMRWVQDAFLSPPARRPTPRATPRTG